MASCSAVKIMEADAFPLSDTEPLTLNVDTSSPSNSEGSQSSADIESIASILVDAIEELGDEELFKAVKDGCTPQESARYRALLRAVGPSQFCAQVIYSGEITAKKLITAFGIKAPDFMDGSCDEDYYQLLSLAISRELSKRMKLPQYNSIDDAVELLKKSNNIILLTGAGISTSLGIPDFRSKDGLYALVKERGFDIEDPQEVFSLEKFREDPAIFFAVAKEILPSTEKFTPTHAFIELLQRKGKLLCNYTQNIDNIEAAAGVLPEKIVQCHGSFATATCQDCGWKVPGETIYKDIINDTIPRCEKCDEYILCGLKSKKRKRSKSGKQKKRRRGSSDDDDENDDVPEAGIMKPDITFFGEQLPDIFSDRLTNHDKDRVDLVIVIGTSLKVSPVSEVVAYLPPHVPQMYISMTPVTHVNFDIDMMGECDVIVSELCRRAGWNLEHEMIPKDEKVEVKLEEGYKSRHVFTSNKKQ